VNGLDAKLLTRLVRAIMLEDYNALRQFVFTIIESEEKIGHHNLVKQLNELISNSQQKNNDKKTTNKTIEDTGLSELPISRRYNQTLATIITRDELQHHMVLPNDLEKRFDRIEKEYAARERLFKHNLKPRSKILLYGPPGCGKTLGAERLAWNLGLPLMKVKFDAIISSYFGESAANLRSIFEMSYEKPCVFLLDECDFIAKSRTVGRDVGEVPRIVNTLLLLLDEYSAPGILVATTNLEASLDHALFRRFDEVIEISRPSEKEIFALFTMTLSAFKISKDINWDKIIEQVKNMSAANIVSIAKNAAKTSVLESVDSIVQKHIEQAISEISKY
jgi:SpoVK/Ycf46/Vps4 family AAA+-type ATPase